VAYEVLRVAVAGRVVTTFTKRERRAYEAAVEALRGEGCAAGGKRLLALDGYDHALCQRALYGSWRMTTAYRGDASIVIVAIGRHTRQENPNRVMAVRSPAARAASERGGRRPAASSGSYAQRTEAALSPGRFSCL